MLLVHLSEEKALLDILLEAIACAWLKVCTYAAIKSREQNHLYYLLMRNFLINYSFSLQTFRECQLKTTILSMAEKLSLLYSIYLGKLQIKNKDCLINSTVNNK